MLSSFLVLICLPQSTWPWPANLLLQVQVDPKGQRPQPAPAVLASPCGTLPMPLTLTYRKCWEGEWYCSHPNTSAQLNGELLGAYQTADLSKGNYSLRKQMLG